MSNVWPLECITKRNGRKSLKYFFWLSFNKNIHTHTRISFTTQLMFTYISTHETTSHRKIQSIFNNPEYFLYLFPVSIPFPEWPLLDSYYPWIHCLFLHFLQIVPNNMYSCAPTSSIPYYFLRFIHDIVFFFLFYCCIVSNFMKITIIYLSFLDLIPFELFLALAARNKTSVIVLHISFGGHIN